MKARELKTEFFGFLLTRSEAKRLKEAARLEDRTVAAFSRLAVLNMAEERLRAERAALQGRRSVVRQALKR